MSLNTAAAPRNTLNLVSDYHVIIALGIKRHTLSRWINQGRLVAPDFHEGSQRFWQLSTIKNWNPDVGDAIAAMLERLPLKLPRIAA